MKDLVDDHDFEPLPPYTDPRAVLRRCLASLRPAVSVSVTESAEAYMRVKIGDQWQPFRRDVTPYMVEPTDMLASRRYRGLTFCGPSQSGKTQCLIQAPLAHTIMSDPGRIAIFQMTQDAAREFEKNKLSPMVRNSPALKARKATGRGADNIYQKIYVGGTDLSIDWPTITKLSSATMRIVLGTDYDHFPESIEGEGDAYTLMRARARTLQSRGMVGVESSPAAPIIDEHWRPSTPHDSPPVRYGVLALYPSGTRGRWYWTCPECDEKFEPTFKRLRYPRDVQPAEAGERAEMACPHCGGLIGHHQKRELNATGRWLHEAADGKRLVPISDPDLRRTDLVSYHLDGAAAAFSTWAELVTQYEQALIAFETTGDEEKLKSAVNTGQGQPYLPRSSLADNEISLQGLKDKAVGNEIEKGVAPDWTRYITISIDTQGTFFSVGVTAWGMDGRHQPIDRFEINTPPPDAPMAAEDRTLKPFDYAEDWEALASLPTMVWPVEGQTFGLRAFAIALDMQGGAATTENAYKFFRARRKKGEGKLWHLTRGEGGNHADRVWQKAPERTSGTARRGRTAATDIRILHMSTDRLKDAVSASLRMPEAGQNYCGIPEWMTEPQLVEFTAERREEKGWKKRPGLVRNESLDHLVQARALHIIKKCERIEWSNPPSWAVFGTTNDNAVLLSDSRADSPASVPVKKAPARIKFLTR